MAYNAKKEKARFDQDIKAMRRNPVNLAKFAVGAAEGVYVDPRWYSEIGGEARMKELVALVKAKAAEIPDIVPPKERHEALYAVALEAVKADLAKIGV